jgi:hypothetical protein
MALTRQNVPTSTSVAKAYIAPGASEVTTPDEEGQGETVYVVAELDSDGKPVSYLPALAAREFGPDVTYRLTPDLALAWPFPEDRDSAQDQADRFNSAPGNPHLTVIER